MEKVFFSASADALSKITYLYDFIHPLTASMRFTRDTVTDIVNKDPSIQNNDIRQIIDPASSVHGANYRRAFIDTSWENQEENIAWLLLNNLFAIHEGWAERLAKEVFKRSQASAKTFTKNLERDDLSKKLSSYFLQKSQQSSIMEDAFFSAYKSTSGLDFNKLDNYMLCYRCFKEARNCFMHKNFIASSNLIKAHRKYLPKATKSALDVSEVPIFQPPTLGTPVKLSLRGVIGFSQIVRRIIIISDAHLLRSKDAEKDFLNRIPNNWTAKTLSTNPVNSQKQICKFCNSAGFLSPTWSIGFQNFLIQNHIFNK